MCGVDVGGTNTDVILLLTLKEDQKQKEKENNNTERLGATLVTKLQSWISALHNEARFEEEKALQLQLDNFINRSSASKGIVLAYTKTSTREDVGEGVRIAVSTVLGNIWHKSELDAICIGTTAFVNAIVERRMLAKVAVIRLCSSASVSLPPFSSFPFELASIVEGHWVCASGGYEMDGSEIAPIDDAEICEFVKTCVDKDIHCIVVSGIFSPVRDTQEKEVASKIKDEFNRLLLLDSTSSSSSASNFKYAVTLSHEVAGLSLMEREAAAILNATVQPLAQRTIASLVSSLSDTLQLSCPIFLTQNDGTVCPLMSVMRLPIKTFSCGPTNSIRGAAFLTGEQDAVVLDIGGTTTDCGLIRNGLPQQSGVHAEIGGVQTCYSIPDVISIGLGGGSLVQDNGHAVGPQSVGHHLQSQARSFGGSVTTATDIAIVRGKSISHTIVDRQALCSFVTEEEAHTAWNKMQISFAQLLDRARTSSEPVKAIIVGGGSILVGKCLQGAAELIQPFHASVANAVGAAIAQVGGSVDRIYDFSVLGGREYAFEEAIDIAKRCAREAGGLEHTLTVIEREEIPLAYLPGACANIRVKVRADLDFKSSSSTINDNDNNNDNPASLAKHEVLDEANLLPLSTAKMETGNGVHFKSWSPSIHHLVSETESITLDESGDWIVSAADVDCIALGAGVLGTGGGGNPFR